MSKASGKILLRKDPDLCFKINIDGFHTARVRLWSQNHPTNPPTPDLSISIVVTIFGETLLVYFILLKVKKNDSNIDLTCTNSCTKQKFS